MSKVDGLPKVAGAVTGSGARFAFDYKGPDSAIAINRLLKDGARVAVRPPLACFRLGNPQPRMEQWHASTG